MDGDDPWPDDDELRDAETLNRVARKKRVPKGMSEYQAAWIIDSGECVTSAMRGVGTGRCWTWSGLSYVKKVIVSHLVGLQVTITLPQ